MYCLLQILMNEEDLQEMNMIILGCYCTFSHKQQLKVNFQILMEIMHSYILYYFFVILPALLHFCSFIYTAFLCIKGQPLFLKRAFPKGKRGVVKKTSRGYTPRLLSTTSPQDPWLPRDFVG